MILILTEKPSVTKQVKEVLAPRAKYIVVVPATKSKPPVGYYEDANFVICNSVGHIVNIKNPKDIDEDFTWDLSKLPYAFPEELPLEIQSGNKDIFKGIQTCFTKYDYDEIVIATDGDREGQNIWRKIDIMLRRGKKTYKTKEINRMWLDEWTPEGIRHSFDNRFPNREKDTLASAAQCREEADYIIGMDCTTALTCKYARGKNNVASIGRVMGPTMHIVVERENEIKNFKPETYMDVTLETGSETDELLSLKRKSNKRLTLAEAKALKDSLQKHKDTVINKTTKKTSKRCPELYDATTIAQDMNKRFGYSAKKTADIIQKLYQDYALTTYPGTNARKISVGSAKNAFMILNNLTLYKDITKEILDNHWDVSSHVVTTEGLAHEAITPVYGSINTANIAKLTKEEMNVYKAIIERYLAVFYPKAEYEEVTLSTSLKNEDFETRGKTLLEAGWTKVLGAGKDVLLPPVLDGKSYPIKKVDMKEKQTTPPSRYSEDTLLSAMKNAGRFVDDKNEAAILNSKEVEGLGTGRTRPAIIENIKKRGYFEVIKKQIHPTQKCLDLFEVLPNTMLSSPSLTAQFEEMIQEVEDGKLSHQEYISRINQQVNEIIEIIKKDTSGKTIGGGSSTTGGTQSSLICPVCGSPIHETDMAYGCSNWKNGCKFTVWKKIAGKKLTESQVKALIQKGMTGEIKGFKSKSGKEFNAYLVLDENKNVKFSFEKPVDESKAKSSKVKAAGSCPKCGKEMYEDSTSFFCSECNLKLRKDALAKLGKAKITKKEAMRLLDGETIEVELYSTKKQKKYTGRVYMDMDTGWCKLAPFK